MSKCHEQTEFFFQPTEDKITILWSPVSALTTNHLRIWKKWSENTALNIDIQEVCEGKLKKYPEQLSGLHKLNSLEHNLKEVWEPGFWRSW